MINLNPSAPPSFRTRFSLFSLVLALAGGGCAASHGTTPEDESPNPESSAPQTSSSATTLKAGQMIEKDGVVLSVIESSDERLSVRASDESANVSITLAKGPVRDLNYIGDVELDGHFEGDALVESEAGHPFLVEIGGDDLVDESWWGRLEAAPGTFDVEQRKKELSLAARASEILGAETSVGDEQRRLARDLAGHAAVSFQEWSREGAPQGEEAPSTVLPGTIEKAVTPTYVHQVFIRKGSCCWTFGEHSATRVKVFNSSGGLVADISTNNHGRNATDASLTTAAGCPDSWSGRTNKLPTFQPYKSSDTTVNGLAGGGSGGCKTSYSVASGSHVCNDDSLAQYTNVARNEFAHWATCSDSGIRSVAPRCN